MKKISDFIVDKRYFVILSFIVFAVLSMFLSTKVNINDDISKYLPSNSETRLGMDIMEDNFDEIKSSSLYVMFKDLNKSEKNDILKSLEKTNGVSSVKYDDTEEYNKDNNTLYILNVDDTSNSKTAKKLYDELKKSYKDHKMFFGGSIAEANKPVLKMWVVALAIVFAMIILIIMCDSYIEPFLFLFTIGIGVFLNKGTNIMFKSVSNITDSISAILQMALSMDYSIMLMNRYTQEKEKEKDKIKAMKKALHASFSSISSSSVTTIVGLLALVFMSFTIGRDLGFVLAKGVLFSLISIFTCLPGLILLFDNLINKTKKKSVNLKLDKLGNFSFKMRYASIFVFIILFILSFILKGNLRILYTDAETDEIKKVFKETNQIAIIYNNEYEDIISNYCKTLEKEENPNIDQILCYGNTLNDELTYKELNNRLKSFKDDFELDDELFKILYYNFYNKNNNLKLTMDKLVTFVKSDVLTNEMMKDHINNETKNSINKLSYFSSSKKINKAYSSKELAKILDINKNDIDNLLVYYNSKNINNKISISQFIDFMNNTILKDKTYASMIDKNTQESLKLVSQFTNKEFINNNMSAKSLSSIFGIDEDSIKSLMLLYYLNNETDSKMTIQEFIKTTYYLKENTNYLDSKDVSSITNLIKFANINNSKKKKDELSYLFGNIAPTLVNMLPDNIELTPTEFIELVINDYGSMLTEQQVSQLKLLYLIITDTKTKYTASSLASLLNQNQKSIISIYALNDYISKNTSSWIVSPYTLVKIIIDNKNNELIKSKLDNKSLNQIELLYNIMDGVINNKTYTYKELSSMLNTDSSKLRLIYSLYDIKTNKKTIKVSLIKFINFIEQDVLNNNIFKDKFTNEQKDKINTISTIMNNSLDNKTYSSKEMYATLNNLSDKLNKNMIDLIYIYYGSVNNYNNEWTISVEDFITYINDDILNDKLFKDFFKDDMVTSVNDAKELINDSKNMLVSDNYSRMIINTRYDDESDTTFNFIQSIKDSLNSKNKEIYVIGNSPMAHDISGTFDKEMTLITILTMLSIFVVVAITFKSFIIPTILVLIIQCAVYITMSILSVLGGSVYFIALLIVQSILMGATIDYAILYTSYYRESRKKMNIKEAIINSYNKSIHTILTSSSILIIVTLIVGNFASAIAAKICKTISEGTLCSLLLILLTLPSLLALFDKFVYIKKIQKHKKL
ncbi:MAG: MMPL family transporter [Erysipelotrichales bacterium]|nr:MMPL family transporter [Erysipelotrichales bacterium]